MGRQPSDPEFVTSAVKTPNDRRLLPIGLSMTLIINAAVAAVNSMSLGLPTGARIRPMGELSFIVLMTFMGLLGAAFSAVEVFTLRPRWRGVAGIALGLLVLPLGIVELRLIQSWKQFVLLP